MRCPRKGRLEVSGVLDFDTVPSLLAQAEPLWPEAGGDGALQIDLAGVTHANSAGLALLLHWLRRARNERRTVSVHNMPAQLQGLARLSGVEGLLVAQDRDKPAQASAATRRPSGRKAR